MTDPAPSPVGAIPEPIRRARRWGVFIAALWLFYLFLPFQRGWEHRDTVRGVLGMVVTVVFALAYVGVFVAVRRRRSDFAGPRRFIRDVPVGLAVVAAMGLLVVAMCVCVGQPGTAGVVYVAVLAVLSLPAWLAWTVAIVIAIGTYVATTRIDGWTSDQGVMFGTLAATLAIWGISNLIQRNGEVLVAREENARLAVDNERNRFARDLHDILGHSLTVITVKAELANRLFEADPERARAELVDLERLSRDALADVRRAVEGYRELTLPGEIARARTALEAAEIAAVLPNSTDEVPTDLRELFAWTVREGVTNVIRHSGARTCTVRLTPRSAEVVDDGSGTGEAWGTGGLGHGLVGLRERAAAVGAEVCASPTDRGFKLLVAIS